MTLLVAATEAELCGHAGLACGVGPVEAAVATTRALAAERPDAVLHVGVAGGVELEPGTLVLGSQGIYADIAAAIPVVARVEPDDSLLALLREELPEALELPIATSATVGMSLRLGSDPTRTLRQADPMGTDPLDVLVEGMEGFAVLRACAVAGVPAVELRSISNELGERDRSRWELQRGLDALGAALPRLLEALKGFPAGG